MLKPTSFAQWTNNDDEKIAYNHLETPDHPDIHVVVTAGKEVTTDDHFYVSCHRLSEFLNVVDETISEVKEYLSPSILGHEQETPVFLKFKTTHVNKEQFIKELKLQEDSIENLALQDDHKFMVLEITLV